MFSGFGFKTTAAATLMGALFIAKPVSASEFGLSFNFGHVRPVVYSQPCAPAVQRRWVAEHCETRSEQVLVSPERTECVWVPETYQTEYCNGHRTTVRNPGYYRNVVVAAQYETRTYEVCIPGYWEEVRVENCGTQYTQTCGIPVAMTYERNDYRWDRWNSDRRDSDRRDSRYERRDSHQNTQTRR